MEPSREWLDEAKKHIREAEQCEHKKQYASAIDQYNKALDLVPEPREASAYSTRLLSNLGEIYFQTGEFEDALDCFSQAVRCKGGLGFAQLHLRLGQLRFELGEMERAKDELMRAYMGSGMTIFKYEDPKYFELIKNDVEKNA